MSDESSKCNWNDLTASKSEYNSFHDALLAKLGKIEFTMTQTGSDLQRPIPPGALDPTAGVNERVAHQRSVESFTSEMKLFNKDFYEAKGTLRRMFVEGCRALREINQIMSKAPAGMAAVAYTPELQFRAALLHLETNYAPRDPADVSALQAKLANLNDIDCGGLLAYHQEFEKTVRSLEEANVATPNETLTQFALRNIKNQEIHKLLYTEVVLEKKRHNQVVTYHDLFETGIHYLKDQALIGQDPYHTASASPMGKPLVAAAAGNRNGPKPPSAIRCTKCWRTNHTWEKCNAKSCSQCGSAFNASPYCTNYATHKEPATRFVPRKFLNPRTPDPKQGKLATVTPDPAKDTLKEAVKNARKALAAATKAIKRARAEGDG